MEEKPPKETEKGLLGLGVGGQDEKSKRMMLWKEGKQFHEGKGHLQCQFKVRVSSVSNGAEAQ